jgi:microcystin-dependent protein
MALVTKGKTFTNGELVTPAKIHQLVDSATVSNIVNADISAGAAISLSKLATEALPVGITVASANIVDGTITNADISASAAIVDTKLATISAGGKVSNSATTATSANTASTIVARDASRNFAAGTITATLAGNATGNAGTATILQNARAITLSTDATGSVSFNGSANVTIPVTIANNAITTAKLADANVTTAKIADGAVTLSKLNSSVILVPTGAVMAFAMNSAPSGWLAANGSAVSRTTYAALFAAIGTTYGTGDGSTTFSLPDLRGYFVRGAGTNGDGVAAGTFGAKQTDDFKSHTHEDNGGYIANEYDYSPGEWPGLRRSLNIVTGATGGTETRPRNIAMLYCIKA